MSPLSVLDMFSNHICHQNMFRNDFGKIDFLVDFQIFYLWVWDQKPRKTAINHQKPQKPVLEHLGSLISKMTHLIRP